MAACTAFKGGIIAISHDERFVNGVANQVSSLDALIATE
jgi:ATPase subunit of ABC transporter with duplicated ATPase domains